MKSALEPRKVTQCGSRRARLRGVQERIGKYRRRREGVQRRVSQRGRALKGTPAAGASRAPAESGLVGGGERAGGRQRRAHLQALVQGALTGAEGTHLQAQGGRACRTTPGVVGREGERVSEDFGKKFVEPR
jgi:hypothetical protein